MILNMLKSSTGCIRKLRLRNRLFSFHFCWKGYGETLHTIFRMEFIPMQTGTGLFWNPSTPSFQRLSKADWGAYKIWAAGWGSTDHIVVTLRIMAASVFTDENQGRAPEQYSFFHKEFHESRFLPACFFSSGANLQEPECAFRPVSGNKT